MADCVHQLGLCPDCGGLAVTRLDRLPGVASVEIDGDGPFSFGAGATVYAGPAPDLCPSTDPAPPEG